MVSLQQNGEKLRCACNYLRVYSRVTLIIYVYIHAPVLFHKEQAMQLFAQLVRLLLGHDAIAARKLEFGVQLVILGMLVRCLTLGKWSILHPGPACLLQGHSQPLGSAVSVR